MTTKTKIIFGTFLMVVGLLSLASVSQAAVPVVTLGGPTDGSNRFILNKPFTLQWTVTDASQCVGGITGVTAGGTSNFDGTNKGSSNNQSVTVTAVDGSNQSVAFNIKCLDSSGSVLAQKPLVLAESHTIRGVIYPAIPNPPYNGFSVSISGGGTQNAKDYSYCSLGTGGASYECIVHPGLTNVKITPSSPGWHSFSPTEYSFPTGLTANQTGKDFVSTTEPSSSTITLTGPSSGTFSLNKPFNVSWNITNSSQCSQIIGSTGWGTSNFDGNKTSSGSQSVTVGSVNGGQTGIFLQIECLNSSGELIVRKTLNLTKSTAPIFAIVSGSGAGDGDRTVVRGQNVRVLITAFTTEDTPSAGVRVTFDHANGGIRSSLGSGLSIISIDHNPCVMAKTDVSCSATLELGTSSGIQPGVYPIRVIATTEGGEYPTETTFNLTVLSSSTGKFNLIAGDGAGDNGNRSVARGQTVNFLIRALRNGNTPGSTNAYFKTSASDIVGLPAGASLSNVSGNPCVISSGNNFCGTLLGIDVSESVTPGTYPITFTATSESGTYPVQVTANLTVVSAPANYITFISPVAGDNWELGSTHQVSWVNTTGFNADVKITLSSLAETPENSVTKPYNQTTWDWTIPSSIPVGSYVIRATTNSGAGNITYPGPTITISAAGGGIPPLPTFPNCGATEDGTWASNGSTAPGGHLALINTSSKSAAKAGCLAVGTNKSDPAYHLEVGVPGINNGIMFVSGLLKTHTLTVASAIVGAGPSDIRLKENVTPLTSMLAKVMKLNPVSFSWNETAKAKTPQLGNGSNVGLIAQETEKIFPEVVKNNPTGYKSIDYSSLISPLIKTLQEQRAQINTLKQEISELEANK